MALRNAGVQTKGVDSTEASHSALASAKELALQTGAVVVISGETDYITDGKMVETVCNGSRMMAKVTGMHRFHAQTSVRAFPYIHYHPD